MSLRECHREFFKALCDVFGEAVNVLLKLAVEKSKLDKSKVAALIDYIEAPCIDKKKIIGDVKASEFSKDDAYRLMYAFFSVLDEILGESALVLAKIAVENLSKHGKDLLNSLDKLFGQIAEMIVEDIEGGVRCIFRPRMKDAHKHMPMTSGVPFPALIYFVYKLGENFKVTKLEHVPNEYCLIEAKRI